MKRYPHDLSHLDFNVGNMNQLQTITNFAVMAGDSIEVDLKGIFRLSTLRRSLTVNCVVDLFAFFVPHRHIYGDSWIDFIKAGTKEVETFTGVTAVSNTEYLGTHYDAAEVIPLWVAAGYNRIWNRYFRSPTDTASVLSDTTLLSTALNKSVECGHKCGPLPTPWSTTVESGVSAADRTVASVASFDLTALEQQKQIYRTEVDREYFGQRYNDILKKAYGSGVNTDADERPTLCAHSRAELGGFDIDGTADANLGSYAGKAIGEHRLRMPRKFMPEHGAVWVMALLRFPVIHEFERPYLNTQVNPNYHEITGDPDIVSAQPPEIYYSDDFFYGHAHTGIGTGPYGPWFNYHPNKIHRKYNGLQGFSFLKNTIATTEAAHYIDGPDYTDIFATEQLNQWQSSCNVAVKAQRVTKPSITSLYTGT